MRVRMLPTGTHESNNKTTYTYLLETDTVTKWSSRLEHGVTTHAALAGLKLARLVLAVRGPIRSVRT